MPCRTCGLDFGDVASLPGLEIEGVSKRTASIGQMASFLGLPWLLKEELGVYIKPVRSKLFESFKDDSQMVYALYLGGYELGAALPQIACEAVGGLRSRALDLAYGYSLGLIAARTVDDMIDRTSERAGKRTLWVEFGDAIGSLLECQLIADMFEALSPYTRSLGGDEVDRIRKILALALHDSARAERQEKTYIRTKADLSFEERVEIARSKRGTLVAAGTTAGAIVGRGNDEEVECLRSYGTLVGTANQLMDDSEDPDYPHSYRKEGRAKAEELIGVAIQQANRLKPSGARRKLCDLCRLFQVNALL